MKTLFVTVAATAMMLTATAQAAVIADLAVNPSSAGGNFSSSPGAGAFTDHVLFQLVGGPQHLTIASVTNTFAAASDFIVGFTASLFGYGADGLFNTADDVQLIAPIAATPCGVPNCQGVAGSAILDDGLYYALFEGTAGATAGYAGNISTSVAAIPVPAAGLLLLGGLGGLAALRRKKA